MPCLLAILGFFFPRLVLVLLWLFTNWPALAFKTALWPVLGFLFMPFTTLAYEWAMVTNGSVSGIYLVVLIIGILLDLGVLGGGGREARRRRLRSA